MLRYFKGYMDYDYTGDLDDMRFTTWYVFTLVGANMSTIEVESTAVAKLSRKYCGLQG